MKIEYRHGTIRYLNEFGRLDREDRPAEIHYIGTKTYYKNGLLHREEEPAMCHINTKNQENTYDYYLNGRFVPKGLFKLYQIGSSIFKTQVEIVKSVEENETTQKKKNVKIKHIK